MHAALQQLFGLVAPLAHRVADLHHRPAGPVEPLDHHRRRSVDQIVHVAQALLLPAQLLGHAVGRGADVGQLVAPLQAGARVQVARPHGPQRAREVLRTAEPQQVQQQREPRHGHQHQHGLAHQFVLHRRAPHGDSTGVVHPHQQTVRALQWHVAAQGQAVVLLAHHDGAGRRRRGQCRQRRGHARMRQHVGDGTAHIQARQRRPHLAQRIDQVRALQALMQGQRTHQAAQHQRVFHAHAQIQLALVDAQALAQALGLLLHHIGRDSAHLVLVTQRNGQQREHTQQQGQQVPPRQAQEPGGRTHAPAPDACSRRSAGPGASKRPQSGDSRISPIACNVKASPWDACPSALGWPDNQTSDCSAL